MVAQLSSHPSHPTCAGGAYNGGVAPGFWTSYGPAFYAPQGRIHYAGTESATRWMGFYEAR